jgi:hypothetical protein
MKKQIIVKPNGLKGNEQLDRIRGLMGNTPINENDSNSVIQLTKVAPDGSIYAVVRENQKYFIKKAEKTDNLVAESFKYLGGLKNKNSEAYPTYAKAIKKLNLKFISLNEAYGKTDVINVFEDDNLLEENAIGVAAMGFVAEEETEMTEEEVAIDEMLDPVGKEDCDIDNDGDSDDSDDYIANKRMKISNAIEEMDSIIDDATKTVNESDVQKYLSQLSDEERTELMGTLKKKA